MIPSTTSYKLGLMLSACCLWLAGCATQAPQPTVAPSTASDSWLLSGKLGVTTPSDRINASIDWQQTGDAYAIELSGPFGRGRTEIVGDLTTITLSNDRETLTSDSPEALMLEQLGWEVPLAHFAYWAKGSVSPLTHSTASELNDQGNLATLTQAGWQLSFSNYTLINGEALPGKVMATRGQLQVKLVTKRWERL